jgi:hypothetical protein
MGVKEEEWRGTVVEKVEVHILDQQLQLLAKGIG